MIQYDVVSPPWAIFVGDIDIERAIALRSE